jgi:hypothetical protein
VVVLLVGAATAEIMCFVGSRIGDGGLDAAAVMAELQELLTLVMAVLLVAVVLVVLPADGECA